MVLEDVPDPRQDCPLELGLEVPTREQRTPEALRAHQKAEADKWWPIIKAANIKPQ